MGKATKLDVLVKVHTTNHVNLVDRFFRSGGDKLPSGLMNHRKGAHPRGKAYQRLLKAYSFHRAKINVMRMTSEEFEKMFKDCDKTNPVYRLYEHIHKTGKIPPVRL